MQILDKTAYIKMLKINHSGEIAAQALYQGQGLFAKTFRQKLLLKQAALEELEHLNLCAGLLEEYQARPSSLSKFWYAGAFVLGAGVSLLGDKASLAFLAETEFQVAEHLAQHLESLGTKEPKLSAAFRQMHDDELKHAHTAKQEHSLPKLAAGMMRATAKIFKFLAANT